MLPHFKAQELANLLWALATMGHYPGPAALDALAAAAAGVAGRMKPQELANSCWAWATLRHFPGPRVMDAMLAAAAAALPHFKSQELGNLMWAAARLAYMPASRLAEPVMQQVARWKSCAVQVGAGRGVCLPAAEGRSALGRAATAR